MISKFLILVPLVTSYTKDEYLEYFKDLEQNSNVKSTQDFIKNGGFQHSKGGDSKYGGKYIPGKDGVTKTGRYYGKPSGDQSKSYNEDLLAKVEAGMLKNIDNGDMGRSPMPLNECEGDKCAEILTTHGKEYSELLTKEKEIVTKYARGSVMIPIYALKNKDFILNGDYKEFSKKLPISMLYTQMTIQKVKVIKLEATTLLEKFRYDTIFATIQSVKPWFNYESKKISDEEISEAKKQLAEVESTLSDIIAKWSNIESYLDKILNYYYEMMMSINKVEGVEVGGKIYERNARNIRDLFVDVNKIWMEMYKGFGV